MVLLRGGVVTSDALEAQSMANSLYNRGSVYQGDVLQNAANLQTGRGPAGISMGVSFGGGPVAPPVYAPVAPSPLTIATSARAPGGLPPIQPQMAPALPLQGGVSTTGQLVGGVPVDRVGDLMIPINVQGDRNISAPSPPPVNWINGVPTTNLLGQFPNATAQLPPGNFTARSGWVEEATDATYGRPAPGGPGYPQGGQAQAPVMAPVPIDRFGQMTASEGGAAPIPSPRQQPPSTGGYPMPAPIPQYRQQQMMMPPMQGGYPMQQRPTPGNPYGGAADPRAQYLGDLVQGAAEAYDPSQDPEYRRRRAMQNGFNEEMRRQFFAGPQQIPQPGQRRMDRLARLSGRIRTSEDASWAMQQKAAYDNWQESARLANSSGNELLQQAGQNAREVSGRAGRVVDKIIGEVLGGQGQMTQGQWAEMGYKMSNEYDVGSERDDMIAGFAARGIDLSPFRFTQPSARAQQMQERRAQIMDLGDQTYDHRRAMYPEQERAAKARADRLEQTNPDYIALMKNRKAKSDLDLEEAQAYGNQKAELAIAQKRQKLASEDRKFQNQAVAKANNLLGQYNQRQATEAMLPPSQREAYRQETFAIFGAPTGPHGVPSDVVEASRIRRELGGSLAAAAQSKPTPGFAQVPLVPGQTAPPAIQPVAVPPKPIQSQQARVNGNAPPIPKEAISDYFANPGKLPKAELDKYWRQNFHTEPPKRS